MKSNQRGGVVSFVIVGLALAGLLAGGLYLSKHQARVARDSDVSTPAVSTVKKDETPEKTKEEPKGESNAPASPAGQSGTTTNPRGNNAPQQTAPTAPTNRVASTGPSESIPSTGPGDVAVVALGLGVLSFTGYRLMQSRRSVHHAALRR